MRIGEIGFERRSKMFSALCKGPLRVGYVQQRWHASEVGENSLHFVVSHAVHAGPAEILVRLSRRAKIIQTMK